MTTSTMHATAITGEVRPPAGETRYLVTCGCGWSDGWYLDRYAAQTRAREHVAAAAADAAIVAGPFDPFAGARAKWAREDS